MPRRVGWRPLIRRNALFISSLGLAGCAPPPAPTAPVPKVSFTFKPPEKCATPASAKVTFAIIQPQWKSGTPGMGGAPGIARVAALQSASVADYMRPGQLLYDELTSSMKNDFLALLNCKGFTTRGPFRTYEEMVYPDRTGSDLALVPEIDLKLATEADAAPVSTSFSQQLLAAATRRNGEPQPVTLKGRSTITGRVTLTLRESITNVSMWSKSIEVVPETFDFTSEKTYPPGYSALFSEIVVGDPGFQRQFGPRLTAFYQTALSTAWRYLDVREMELVKRQSAEPRSKASIRVPRGDTESAHFPEGA